jgi:putative nucleotidyltransferase with HDIG domain
LSLLFAVIFTALSVCELYLPGLTPRLGLPTPVTIRVPYGPRIVQDARNSRSHLSYEYRRVTIPRGTVLDEANDDHRAAFAYESSRRRPRNLGMVASFFAIYFIIFQMLTAYLGRFGQNRVRLLRPQAGLLLLMLEAIIITKAVFLFTALPEFWIPLAALPLWVALAFDRRTAFIVDLSVAFIACSLLRFDIVLFSVLMSRGSAATLFFVKAKQPRQLLLAGALAGLAGVIAYTCLTVVFEGTISVFADINQGLRSNLIACVGGGIVAGIIARTVREAANRVMGHVSRDRLLDLTDLEQPLLKKMAAEAPGSWEHARAMANLAEASAAAIHADALLTRVGAYYHDLGKTIQPKYFVENLAPGERTPHEDLAPEVSADAIMAHVVMGTKILRQGGIPEPVVEFAYTHHGTQIVEYFWHKCHEQGNPRGLTQDHFRYPGMKPQTKETAILMLVDSIEAASRTIWPPEQKKFEEMIQRIIFTKLSGGQLDESGLTLEDLRIMTSRMASTLVNMYHGRIKYPWQREAERSQATSTPLPGAVIAGENAEKAAPKKETNGETSAATEDAARANDTDAAAAAGAPTGSPAQSEAASGAADLTPPVRNERGEAK